MESRTWACGAEVDGNGVPFVHMLLWTLHEFAALLDSGWPEAASS